jgi:hypothetical protein
VPIVKYFVVVGAALAVLLLIAGWSLPESPVRFSDHPEIIDRAIIRIRSERKWPEKVVLDTSRPTMAPSVVVDPPAAQSSVPIPPDESPRQSNLEAMARLEPDTPPAALDSPSLQVKRGVTRTVRPSRVARGSTAHRLVSGGSGLALLSIR